MAVHVSFSPPWCNRPLLSRVPLCKSGCWPNFPTIAHCLGIDGQIVRCSFSRPQSRDISFRLRSSPCSILRARPARQIIAKSATANLRHFEVDTPPKCIGAEIGRPRLSAPAQRNLWNAMEPGEIPYGFVGITPGLNRSDKSVALAASPIIALPDIGCIAGQPSKSSS